MKQLKTTFAILAIFIASCTSKTSTISSENPESNSLSSEYTQVPKEELVASTPTAQKVYADLTNKYNADLLELKKEVENIGAKFELVFLTPECGEALTSTQRIGKSVIESSVANNGINLTDLTNTLVTNSKSMHITQMPKDGHLSKDGAKLVATDLLAIVKKHAGFMAPISDNLKSKPSTFGDLAVNSDEILDGGKDLPYRMITNSQGLRLDYEVSFPKKKQRILLFGDSIFFCPFLDNQDGIAQQLQAMYPNAEIINTANWGYSIDDYLSLFKEKAKFLEPDLVIVQTSGNDILDYYFSNRLKLSRNKASIKPTEAELALYKELYTK